jgi:hypothetical protein
MNIDLEYEIQFTQKQQIKYNTNNVTARSRKQIAENICELLYLWHMKSIPENDAVSFKKHYLNQWYVKQLIGDLNKSMILI